MTTSGGTIRFEAPTASDLGVDVDVVPEPVELSTMRDIPYVSLPVHEQTFVPAALLIQDMRPSAPNRYSGWSNAVQVQGWPHGEVKEPLRPGGQVGEQFKPLKAYEAERRRGLMHTPEHEERMRLLKEELQRWLLAE